MKANKYHIVALIYFFVNGFLLPEGMLYTILLTPVFYIWLIRNGVKNLIGWFALFWTPWAIAHFLVEVDLFYYFRSSVMLFTAYIFVYAVHHYIKTKQGLEKLFGKLLQVNFWAVLLALVLFFTPFAKLVWNFNNLTVEMTEFPRIMLLTYEPSYYATLMVPFTLFYLLGILLKPYNLKVVAIILLFLSIPLVFSFSLGVISSLAFALSVTLIYYFKTLIKFRRSFYTLMGIGGGLLFILILVAVVFPNNPLFERLGDLTSGKDTSAQGRTYYAFVLASQILELTNHWVGCGIGQIKVAGNDVIRAFYDLDYQEAATIRIPNTMAETLASFGWIGFTLRIGLEIFLFFKTRVYTNIYRFSMFWYIFLYQFTGSFLTNIAEYVIWVIAFTPCCYSLNLSQFKSSKKPLSS